MNMKRLALRGRALGVHACILAGVELLASFEAHAQAAPPAHGAATTDATSALQVAPGLAATVWASEPMLENPVAFSFDDRGRCFVAETHRWGVSVFDITRHAPWLLDDLSFRTVEDRGRFLAGAFAANPALLTRDSERVRWIEDRDGDGRAESGGVFAAGFQAPTAGTAAGVLAVGGDVWFTCIPDLWRLGSDSAGGEATRRTAVHTGFGVHIGVSGHDLHGLKMGPDGRIYFSIGDRGFHVKSVATRFPTEGGWLFSGDQPDTGAVFRCEPDGSGLEVYAIGLRNPQELTFDAEGNLWTGDNDTAGADDSRLIHVVEGGDYGWRCSYQHMAGFGPWVQEGLWKGGLDDALPSSGTVAQGPSGLDFYPGTGLGPEWMNHMLMCDFPGGVWDFTVKPRGASFILDTRRKLVWNLWPTDVEFGPDGAIYVADWVTGWVKTGKGRIFRLSGAGGGPDKAAARTQKLLKEGFSNRTTAELGALLADPDQRVRLRSQWTLAERGEGGAGEFARVLVTESAPRLARLHAVWGLGQICRKPSGQGSLTKATEAWLAGLKSGDSEVRAQSAKLLGETGVKSATNEIAACLRDAEPRVRFFAGISLGRLGSAASAEPVHAMLHENRDADPYLRHAGVMALLGTMKADAIVRLRTHPFPEVRRAAVLALRRLGDPGLEQFLNDVDPDIAYQAARAINDVPVNVAMSELAKFLGKVDCPSNIVSRAINANLRVGEVRNATVLTAFAGRVDVPESARVYALEALGEWSEPSKLDRVVGLWRPMPSRSVEPARRALRTASGSLFQSRSMPVRIALLKTAVRLNVKEVGQGAADAFGQDGAPQALRLEILRTLAALRHSRWPEVMTAGLRDPDASVQLEALRLAAAQPGAELPAEVDAFLQPKQPAAVRQVALSILGRVQDARAGEVLRGWIDRLESGSLEPELVLDVMEAAAARPEPTLRSRADVLSKAAAARPFPASHSDALAGGDAVRGKQVFLEKAEVACLRCHRVGSDGGPVGPVLDGVGKRLKREELLESILHPNARIATGFEQVLITTRDGSSHAGTVKRETADVVVVENLEEGEVRIPTSSIALRARGQSAMPEGLEALLSRRELRDLVEYLASLR